jgi:hypothetical protein
VNDDGVLWPLLAALGLCLVLMAIVLLWGF